MDLWSLLFFILYVLFEKKKSAHTTKPVPNLTRIPH